MKIKFKILDKKWRIKLYPSKKYVKKHGYDSLAVTIAYKRKIDVHADGFNTETIYHELIHAYLHEMCLSSTNEITKDDLEEIYSELFAKRGEEIIVLCANLMKSIKKIYDENIAQKRLDKQKNIVQYKAHSKTTNGQIKKHLKE